jgi:hypothetical protein
MNLKGIRNCSDRELDMRINIQREVEAILQRRVSDAAYEMNELLKEKLTRQDAGNWSYPS